MIFFYFYPSPGDGDSNDSSSDDEDGNSRPKHDSKSLSRAAQRENAKLQKLQSKLGLTSVNHVEQVCSSSLQIFTTRRHHIINMLQFFACSGICHARWN
jgi:hypothetical protein